MRPIVLVLLVAACGAAQDAPAPTVTKPMRTRTFGGDRPAELHTPATLTPGTRYPLVVLLHGYNADSGIQSAYLQMDALSDAGRALWIAPDGTVNTRQKRFWNAGPECCDRDQQNPDDVAYVGSLIESIVAEWPVDPARIYVIGHSNGAFMAYRMARERADLIAAVMTLAGRVPSVGPAPSRPVSVLHIHGTDDEFIPYSFGPEAVEQFARFDGCGTTRVPTVTLDLDVRIPGAETRGERSTGCPPGVDVELWTIAGGLHVPDFPLTISTTVLDWLDAHHR